MADNSPAPISSDEQQAETPQELAALWGKELSAAKDAQKKWWDRAEKIVKRYLDDRTNQGGTRLNLFTANTQTMEALLFGKTPEVGVQRRFADSQDDIARVAAELLERILNTDIERDDDTQQEALRNALSDRLIAGFGNVRVRYELGETQMTEGTPAQYSQPQNQTPIPQQAGMGMTMPPDNAQPGSTQPQLLAEAVPPQEMRPNEAVVVDYMYWKDQLWSPCRVFSELRWWAFAAEMSEAQFEERFPGKDDAWTANRKNPSSPDSTTEVKDPLDRCIVWEIWSKEKRCVYWYIQGHGEILDHKEDPLGLANFWPFPRPMFANLTTSKLLPTPDFTLAQDLYNEIDDVSGRIVLLEQAVRVAGVYDKNSEELKRLVSETAQNEMIGVDSWAAFAEKGGVKGATDWLPLDMVMQALDTLRNYRTELIGLLYQITGMSDIMRGQASEQTTATEQAIKARFASVRVQTLQDEFARFASDVQKIKAEIISKHFQPQTILARSNIMQTPDAQMAQQAVQLIQQPDFQFRISVNPDSVSLQDFSAIKQERTEFAQTISVYFQGMMPMVQMLAQVPGGAQASVEFTLNLAQSLCAGLKGANEMEGIFDQFVSKLKQIASQPPPPPQPDPKVQAAQVKAQAEMGKAHAQMQQTQIDGQVHIAKAGMDMQVAKTKNEMDMQKLAAQHVVGIQSEEAKARSNAIKAVNSVSEDGPT